MRRLTALPATREPLLETRIGSRGHLRVTSHRRLVERVLLEELERPRRPGASAMRVT